MNRRTALTLPIAGIAGAAIASLPRIASALPFTDIIDVTSYGIIGDGVTDNLAAYNALNAAVPHGVEAHHPPGDYRVSGPPTITKRMKFSGAGKMSSIIKTTHPTADLFVINQMDTVFESIGLGSSVTKTAGAIVRCNVPLLTMRDVLVDGYYQGIVLNGATLSTIDNVFGGLNVPGTPGSVATGSAYMIVGPNTSAGIQIMGGGCNSAGGTFMPTYGMFISACLDLTMSGFQIMQHGIDLAIGPGSGQVVASVNAVNSYFDTATRGMLICPTGSGAVVRCKFNNCWFSSHTTDGVYVLAPTGTTVQGIHLVNSEMLFNAGRGIITSGPVDYYWLEGNDVHGNALGGILDSATGTHKVVTGNLS